MQGKAPRSKGQKREEGLILFDCIRSEERAAGVEGEKNTDAHHDLTGGQQMTLIKSLLLGSAAGIVAVASAQAADLPTRKAAPVEYVKVCNVGGITGWTLPGSDTCVKLLAGYITAQFTGGNLQTQYNYGSINDALGADFVVPDPLRISPLIPIPTPTGFAQNNQRVLIAASSAQQHNDSIGIRPAGRPAPTSVSIWPRTPPMAP